MIGSSSPGHWADVQSALSPELASGSAHTREEILRQLTLAAWADGVLTDPEREFLLERASDMGLARERAEELVSSQGG